MLKWLIDKAMRAEIAELDAKLSKLAGRLDRLENNYKSLSGRFYREEGVQNPRKKEKSRGNTTLTPQEKAQLEDFMAGCAPGDAEVMRAKLINAGYDV